MSKSIFQRFAIAFAIAAAIISLAAPQKASAGLFDWLGFDEEDAPPAGRPVSPLAPANTPDGEFVEKNAYKEFARQERLDMRMLITKPEWTDEYEIKFGQFVHRLGVAIALKKCNTVKNCMRNLEANEYAAYDPAELIMYSDCADFPIFLRAYFAYQNGLPMSYVSGVSIAKAPVASEPNRDADLATAREDNSPYGNIITKRGGSNAAKAPGQEPNLIEWIDRMLNNVSTRTLRVGPFYPGYDVSSDLYPVAINRGGIRPGTVVHSTGHAMVVYNVTQRGAVQTIDAHPDGSVSFKEVKSATLDRSRPDQALGFFRFRPLKLVGSKKMPRQLGAAVFDAHYGGKVVPATDAELIAAGKYSVEQWFGPDVKVAPGPPIDPQAWKSAYKGINFFDFLAKRMQMDNFQIGADEVVGELMKGLCDEMSQRVTDIEVALKEPTSMNLKQHPSTLPPNIYTAEGDWESYATPSRDARMRASVQDIIRQAVAKFRVAKSGDTTVKFEGSAADYAKALQARVAAMDKSCSVKYTNSAGTRVSLKFSQVLKRLPRMSFDAYHCAERRWGATGEELASCLDSDKGGAWYTAEQNIRNTVGKVDSHEQLIVRSDRPITLSMLQDPSLIDRSSSDQVNLGTAKPPVTDLMANFGSDKFLELLAK